MDVTEGAARRAAELDRNDRAMLWVRLAGVAFALLQVTVTPNQPSWVTRVGLGWTAALLASALLLRWLSRRNAGDPAALTRTAGTGLAVDVTVIMGFVFLYAYDPGSALWALCFIVPLEGAIAFGLAGALGSMATIAVLYTVREIWANAVYGNALLLDSITYRMGIGFIIALVAGLMARNLRREREALRRSLEQLRELDELKDEFLSQASHELRTPLTVIKGFALTLKRFPDLPTERRTEYVEAIVRHGDRLARVANDIIDVTRLERGCLPIHCERVKVDEAVGGILDLLDTEVRLEVEPGLTAWTDPVRLEQIVFNLAHNAEKYGRPPIEISARLEDGSVVISVADDGDGVPPGEESRIFELFYRAVGDSGVSGSGIGLALARRLVEAQGGRLAYEPNRPRGARFTFTLPARPPRGASTQVRLLAG